MSDPILENDPLLQIEGLDYAEGLRFAANSRDLYVRILEVFVANHTHTMAGIRKAVANYDHSSVMYSVHSLKGMAATIGAGKLRNAAKDAEEAILDNDRKELLEKLLVVEELMGSLLQQLSLHIQLNR